MKQRPFDWEKTKERNEYEFELKLIDMIKIARKKKKLAQDKTRIN